MALDALLQQMVSTYGLFGLLAVSIFANATIFMPVPLDILIIGVAALYEGSGAGIQIIFLIGIVASLGAAIGELTSYTLGRVGMKAAENLKNSAFRRFLEVRERIRTSGMLFIFFASLVPFPFDLVGIAAGLIRYSIKRFFIAVFCGKCVRYTVVAYAGYFGVELLKAYFAVPIG